MASVVGRESELEAVERLITGGRSGFAGLVLEGEAGIGKTTVWREAVRAAESSGCTVLRSRPAEAEARLAFASLADLLDPIDAERLSELPEPQRHAIEVALLRTHSGRPLPDARAVATGVLSLLGSLAEEPLLVAIDDAQWLDRSSAAALSFALRRIDPTSPVGPCRRGSCRDRAGTERPRPRRRPGPRRACPPRAAQPELALPRHQGRARSRASASHAAADRAGVRRQPALRARAGPGARRAWRAAGAGRASPRARRS